MTNEPNQLCQDFWDTDWPLDRSKWHPCTSLWQPIDHWTRPIEPGSRPHVKWGVLECRHRTTKTICRAGRIDHWMYMKDNTQALINYNACSMYRPSGPEWQLCL